MKRKNKIGRNALCPCKSGKKYKKCCLPLQKIVKDLHQKVEEGKIKELEYKKIYGDVRPAVSLEVEDEGIRYVAVGCTIFSTSNTEHFGRFLINHIIHTFGEDWLEKEQDKSVEQQHPVVQWQTKGNEYINKQKLTVKDGEGFIPSGDIVAFMALAYDLYVIEHNSELDDTLISRLKINDQFQGARHEVFAEATCIRAGYKIEHEDNSDPSKKHAEFIAVNKKTGFKIAVEAKSRHRAGILGQPGEKINEFDFRYGRLLNDAFSKLSNIPLVIFLDLNLPPANAKEYFEIDPKTGHPVHITKFLDSVREKHKDKDPYNCIILTNHPHHYSNEDEIDPERKKGIMVSDQSEIKIENFQPLFDLYEAVGLYGKIPDKYPDF